MAKNRSAQSSIVHSAQVPSDKQPRDEMRTTTTKDNHALHLLQERSDSRVAPQDADTLVVHITSHPLIFLYARRRLQEAGSSASGLPSLRRPARR